MSIPEPGTTTDLWPRVKAREVWPDVNEDALHDLGDRWMATLPALVETPGAAAATFDRDLAAAWPDEAGFQMRRQLRIAVDGEYYESNRSLEWTRNAIQGLANSLYIAVAKVEHVKTTITRLVNGYRVPYEEADGDRRTEIVDTIVNEVQRTITIYCTEIATDGTYYN